MGMFDNIVCDLPLDLPVTVDEWQTKDTPAQFLDTYRIDADGQLWHKAYDTEDRSRPDAEGFRSAIGCMTRVNHRWEKCEFRGCIQFYGDGSDGECYEFSALFDDGRLLNIRRVQESP